MENGNGGRCHYSTILRSRFPKNCSPYSQSSTLRPVTRLNSLVLCVIRTDSCAKAMAAIIRSFGPIGVPFRARSERISPYLLAASSSKGTLVKSANNSCLSLGVEPQQLFNMITEIVKNSLLLALRTIHSLGSDQAIPLIIQYLSPKYMCFLCPGEIRSARDSVNFTG